MRLTDGVNAAACCAALFSLAVALPAVAQTAATSAVTPNGIVTLSTGSAVPTAAPTTYPSPTASAPPVSGTTSAVAGTSSATRSVGGAGSGVAGLGGGSGPVGGVRGAASARGVSGGSSGSTTGAPSGAVPTWVLCPPPAAPGGQPFFSGTDLSCTP